MLNGINKVWGISRGVARYGVAPWIWVHSLGMGRLHAMCWSRVTLSAKLGKAVSRSLPSSSSQSSRFVYRNAAGSAVEC